MSRNPRKFWQAFERLADGAVAIEWCRELGEGIDRARPLLQLVNGLSNTYPCTNLLGCEHPHRVEEPEPGKRLAVCDGDVWCPSIPVEAKDLFVFAVDVRALCLGIAQCLGLSATENRRVVGARAERVGTFGPASSEVYLMFPGETARMMREVERLFCAQPDPFVLLTPTGVHCSADVESALRRQGCMHLALSRAVAVGVDGRLSRTDVAVSLLAEFERRLAERPKVAPLLQGLHRKIDAGHAERSELRDAKLRLEQMVAEGLLKFAGRIDAESLRIIYAVLGKGDIAKAARELRMKDPTLRDHIRKWKRRGKDYAVLADLVRWRKETKFKGTVPLNEAVLAGESQGADQSQLLSDVLDGLLEMTEGNWQDKCEELAELLKRAGI